MAVTRRGYLALAICAFGVLSIIGLVVPHTPERAEHSPEWIAQVNASVQLAERTGVIRRLDGTHRVYVAPDAWQQFDAQEKQALALTLAQYFEFVRGEQGYVRLYDAQSARELGGIMGGAFYVK